MKKEDLYRIYNVGFQVLHEIKQNVLTWGSIKYGMIEDPQSNDSPIGIQRILELCTHTLIKDLVGNPKKELWNYGAIQHSNLEPIHLYGTLELWGHSTL